MGNSQRLCLLPRRLADAMSQLTPVNTSLCLEQICASNYQKLLTLIPALPSFKVSAANRAAHQSGLHVAVLERSVYTLTIELSQCFRQQTEDMQQPGLRVRVYLDVQLAEVLSDQDRAEVSAVYKDAGRSHDIMVYKWRLNYFLQKWLDYCLHKGYRFTTPDALLAAQDVPLPSTQNNRKPLYYDK